SAVEAQYLPIGRAHISSDRQMIEHMVIGQLVNTRSRITRSGARGDRSHTHLRTITSPGAAAARPRRLRIATACHSIAGRRRGNNTVFESDKSHALSRRLKACRQAEFGTNGLRHVFEVLRSAARLAAHYVIFAARLPCWLQLGARLSAAARACRAVRENVPRPRNGLRPPARAPARRTPARRNRRNAEWSPRWRRSGAAGRRAP